MNRMVRLNQKTYSKLHSVAGELQAFLGRRVSLSDAIEYLLHKRERRARRFWRALRGKKAAGRAGRGPVRRVSGLAARGRRKQQVGSYANELRKEVF